MSHDSTNAQKKRFDELITVDHQWKNITDTTLTNFINGLEFSSDKSYYLDLSGNRLSLDGLRKIIELLKLNENISAGDVHSVIV